MFNNWTLQLDSLVLRCSQLFESYQSLVLSKRIPILAILHLVTSTQTCTNSYSSRSSRQLLLYYTYLPLIYSSLFVQYSIKEVGFSLCTKCSTFCRFQTVSAILREKNTSKMLNILGHKQTFQFFKETCQNLSISTRLSGKLHCSGPISSENMVK